MNGRIIADQESLNGLRNTNCTCLSQPIRFQVYGLYKRDLFAYMKSPFSQAQFRQNASTVHPVNLRFLISRRLLRKKRKVLHVGFQKMDQNCVSDMCNELRHFQRFHFGDYCFIMEIQLELTTFREAEMVAATHFFPTPLLNVLIYDKFTD